jgi:hypothetical protein
MHVAFVIIAICVFYALIVGLQRSTALFFPIFMTELELNAQTTSACLSAMYFVFGVVGKACYENIY